MKTKILKLILIFLFLFTCPLFSQVEINDEFFDRQWYLYMSGSESTRADIRVLDAWSRTMGNSNQKIADIEDDNGYPNTYHPDLLDRIILQGFGFTGEHATNVAGLLVANHDTIGIAGVNKYAQLYSYTYSDVQQWADKVRDARIDGNQIINISQNLNEPIDDVGSQLAKAYNSNIVNVVSTGNNGLAIYYPAIYSSTIAVGASTKYNARSTFSNYGPQIEFLAPGGSDDNPLNEDNIFTTSSNGSYVYKNGTSFAAPLVAGAASLLLAYRSNLTNDDIKHILINSCDKLPQMQGQNFTEECGYGRINLKKAMQLLEAPYVLNNTLSVYGGSVYNVSNYENYLFYGIDGLTNGRYQVKRYEVRKTVSLPQYNDIHIWGRGPGSIGWAIDQPNFGMEFCEVVPGSITSTNATLRTYVYEFFNGLGQSVGWYPAQPENVKLNYTILGIPIVRPIISSLTQSPEPICQGSYGYVYCNLSQGNGTLTYNWSASDLPAGAYITPMGNKCKVTYSYSSLAKDGGTNQIMAPLAQIYCTVSNSAGSDNDSMTPSFTTNCGGCPTLAFEENGVIENENPILTKSVISQEDVTDYYLIQNELNKIDKEIKFIIHEPEEEHTYLDQIELLEVKVNPNEYVAVTEKGEVISYKLSKKGIEFINGNKDDLENSLSSIDDNVTDFSSGDSLIINSESLSMSSNNEDMYLLFVGIKPPIKEQSVAELTTSELDKSSESTPLYARPNKSVFGVKLGKKLLSTMKIKFHQNVEVDFISIVKNEKTAKVDKLKLIEAVHSENGKVIEQLSAVDEKYSEILPGEKISFIFESKNNTDEKVSYILKSVGRYEEAGLYKNSSESETNETVSVPTETKLIGNYPNPFNPTTQISYQLKEAAEVTIKIYDVLGKEVKTLVDGFKEEGYHQVSFDASSLSSGIYFYTMKTKEKYDIKKMLLVR